MMVGMSEARERMTPFQPETSKIATMMDYFRQLFISIAEDLENGVPASRERDQAFLALEEGMFWALAAIARHQDEIITGHTMEVPSEMEPLSV
jgi:hypothetical protein